MSYIKLHNVSKTYTTRNINRDVLRGINIELEESRFYIILGPSGSGKTTILNLIAGFEKPSSGKIIVAGESVVKPGPNRSVVFQSPNLFPWKTAIKNVQCGLDHKAYKKKSAINIAEKILDEVGLENAHYHFPHELSGGMQQRVGIARALVMMPDVLLMDEPFSALDPRVRNDMQELIIKIWQKYKVTIIFITHSIEEALNIGTDIIISNEGRVTHLISNELDYPRDKNNQKFIDKKNHIDNIMSHQRD